jgi:BirA family biotin operon repressor/biotin-[acetyl-CoA-carboxylase] ligase
MEYLVHFDELDSTNTYLKQNWESLPQGIVVTTNKQSAGRGRYNRVWVSQEGGLYFSVLLKPTQQDFLPNLTQLMALCICQTLEKYGLMPQLKWPNDVLINGQKICGILSEAVIKGTRIGAIIIGVGVNLSQDGLEHIDQPATSLKKLGIEIKKEVLLQQILEYFWKGISPLCENGFETIRTAYKQRAVFLGKQVSVTNNDKTIFGLAEDISARGTLLLRTEKGLEEIYIGDVKV